MSGKPDTGSIALLLGPSGVLRYFIDESGTQIAYYIWPAHTDAPKATVFGVHGHGSHASFEFLKVEEPGSLPVYAGSWVEAFNREGYSFASVDLCGCGRSDGLRCYINSWEEYVSNVTQATQLVKTCRLQGVNGDKIFLLGESMGACLALDTIVKNAGNYQGLILCAPMLSLEKLTKRGLNKYLVYVVSLLSWIAPTLPLAETALCEMFPNIQACWDQDPYTYKDKGRARNSSEYMRVCNFYMNNFNVVDVPFLAFHSERDTMTDPDGSKKLYKEASSKDKQLRLVNNMWHFLTKEPGNEQVLSEAIQWLNAHV